MNFLRQGFRKLSSDRQTNNHTYSQTESTEIIEHTGSPLLNSNNRSDFYVLLQSKRIVVSSQEKAVHLSNV